MVVPLSSRSTPDVVCVAVGGGLTTVFAASSGSTPYCGLCSRPRVVRHADFALAARVSRLGRVRDNDFAVEGVKEKRDPIRVAQGSNTRCLKRVIVANARERALRRHMGQPISHWGSEEETGWAARGNLHTIQTLRAVRNGK